MYLDYLKRNSYDHVNFADLMTDMMDFEVLIGNFNSLSVYHEANEIFAREDYNIAAANHNANDNEKEEDGKSNDVSFWTKVKTIIRLIIEKLKDIGTKVLVFIRNIPSKISTLVSKTSSLIFGEMATKKINNFIKKNGDGPFITKLTIPNAIYFVSEFEEEVKKTIGPKALAKAIPEIETSIVDIVTKDTDKEEIAAYKENLNKSKNDISESTKRINEIYSKVKKTASLEKFINYREAEAEEVLKDITSSFSSEPNTYPISRLSDLLGLVNQTKSHVEGLKKDGIIKDTEELANDLNKTQNIIKRLFATCYDKKNKEALNCVILTSSLIRNMYTYSSMLCTKTVELFNFNASYINRVVALLMFTIRKA